jgi:hypothetical protein
MKEFIKDYITPLKDYYLIIGALIALFTLLELAFEDYVTKDFLLGIILFGLLIMFFYVVKDTFYIDIKRRKPQLIPTIYVLILIIFVISLFLSIFKEYDKVFMALSGIFIAILEMILLAKIRGYFVIFQKRFKRTWIKRILRITFTLIFFISLGLLSQYLGLKIGILPENPSLEIEINNLTSGGWFLLILMWFNSFWAIVFSILNLVDIFKKEPMYAKNFVWEKSQIYDLIQKFKKIRENSNN